MLELPARETLACICHDMQNDYLKEGGRTPEAGRDPAVPQLIENHVRLLSAARAAGLPVFFTGHFLREDYLDAARHGRARSLGSLRDGTWGAEVIDELAPQPGEFLIRKGGGMSAFTGTALEKWLRRLGVSTAHRRGHRHAGRGREHGARRPRAGLRQHRRGRRLQWAHREPPGFTAEHGHVRAGGVDGGGCGDAGLSRHSSRRWSPSRAAAT